MDETDYTSGLKGAIEDYIDTLGETRGPAYTPGNRAQSVKSWEHSLPHDIIAWLNNGNLLVLEVKIQTQTGLKSPYPFQYEMNCAFEKAGHPIRYCFNWIEKYKTRCDYLTQSQACKPSDLFLEKNKLRINKNSSLQHLIDELAAQKTPAGNSLAQLIARQSITELQQLLGSTILIIFNNQGHWMVETLDEIVKNISNHISIPSTTAPNGISMEKRVQNVISQAKKISDELLNPEDENTPSGPRMN